MIVVGLLLAIEQEDLAHGRDVMEELLCAMQLSDQRNHICNLLRSIYLAICEVS